jgi:uncharacterized protein with PIN domain
MGRASFHFHAELNDFLPPDRRGGPVEREFRGNPSVKHLIEALGVPHPEVGRILANGRSVDFSYQVQHGDFIDVIPSSPTERGRGLGGELRFLLDNHLGKLATYLRMAGFDTHYRNDYQDPELAETSAREGRVLLTRDQRLLMRSVVRAGYWVRAKSPPVQLGEVLERFGLLGRLEPFRRCVRCNTPLQPVAKEAVLHRLEPLTRRYYDEFHLCPGCGRLYWKGSHFEHMQALLRQIEEASRG